MSESTSAVLFDEIVPPRRPWGRVIRKGQILRLVNLEGQQAVDFLCYDADSPADRYSSMNTIKVQGNLYVGIGTVLYADSGNALFTVAADTSAATIRFTDAAAEPTISCAMASKPQRPATTISPRSWRSSTSTSATS